MYIGIDIGGTTIKYGLVDLQGNVSHKGAFNTPKDKDKIIGELVQVIQQFRGNHSDILGVGISAPGVIKENGFMQTAGAIASLYETNLKDVLEAEIQLPVFVENDANAAAIAEKWIGNAQDTDNYLCLVLGTGIGGGIVINGDVFRGHHGMAGEFGWMMIDKLPDNGNIEESSLNFKAAVVGGLCRLYNQRMQEIDKNFVPIYDARMIFAQEEHHPVAKQLIAEFLCDLAVGLLNLISCFDPDKILIGGGISENQEFFTRLLAEVKRLTERHNGLAHMKNSIAVIQPAKLRNDAGLIGAVYQVSKRI